MQCRKTLRQKLKAFVDSTKILRRSKDNMNKKFLSLVLALVMVLGTLTPVFAEEAAAPKDKIEKAAKTAPSAKVQWLVDQKIVSGRKLFKDGDEKTDLSLDKNLQRDEITRLLVLGRGLENLANLVQGTMRPYVDVDNSNWANGVITVGSYHLKNTQGVPMLAGYPGNKFLPTRNVSYAELAKMLVTLVDNTITPKMVANFQWPSDWMVRAANLGILAGVEVKDSKAFVTRQAAFEMVYNALYIHDTRHNVDYGTKFGVVSGYADGELKLNQGDKAFSVKLSANTVYVDNSGFATYMPLQRGYNGLLLGSLVRVIADKDGNATHIVEMGNPVDGALKGINDRWFGVADKIASGYAEAVDKDGMKIYDGTFGKEAKAATFDGKTAVEINFTANTKFFVADANNGQLTEIKKADALDMLKTVEVGQKNYVEKVYVGYDVNTTRTHINGATVVVFNVVKEDANRTYVRVLNPSNGAYSFFAEKANGQGASYDLSKYNAFAPGYLRPQEHDDRTAGYYGQFEKLNVVSLALVGDTNKVVKADVVIEYAKDPIFKVVDRTRDHAGIWYLTLEGRDGAKLVDVRVKDTTFFNADQFANIKDKYVQVPYEHVANKAEHNLKMTADGFYFDKYNFTDVASILEPGQVTRPLAKVDPAHAQDKRDVVLTVSEVRDGANGIAQLYVTKAVYDSQDPNAQTEVPGYNREVFYVSKAEADMIRESIATNGAPALVKAIYLTNGRADQPNIISVREGRVANTLVKLDPKAKITVDPTTLTAEIGLGQADLNTLARAFEAKNSKPANSLTVVNTKDKTTGKLKAGYVSVLEEGKLAQEFKVSDIATK